MKYISLASCIAMISGLVGCASTHNFAEDGSNILGGGFTTEEIRPGLYRLYARGNKALFPDVGAAQRTWDARAIQLCGPKAYKEFGVVEGRTTGNEATFFVQGLGPLTFRQHDTSKEAYLLCDSSGLSESQAQNALLEKIKAEETQRNLRTSKILSAYDPMECAVGPTNRTAEYFHLMAKDYLEARKFDVAMTCFLKVVSLQTEGRTYRDSCFHIGVMYELGQSVQRDVATAKTWYRKSGDLKD
jgi:hypothetical protein